MRLACWSPARPTGAWAYRRASARPARWPTARSAGSLPEGASQQQDEQHDQEEATKPESGRAVGAASVADTTAHQEHDEHDEDDEEQHGQPVPSLTRVQTRPMTTTMPMPRHVSPMLA